MKHSEILQNLCFYDDRNPNFKNKPKPHVNIEDCFCENCIQGRHEMANFALLLLSEITALERQLVGELFKDHKLSNTSPEITVLIDNHHMDIDKILDVQMTPIEPHYQKFNKQKGKS